MGTINIEFESANAAAEEVRSSVTDGFSALSGMEDTSLTACAEGLATYEHATTTATDFKNTLEAEAEQIVELGKKWEEFDTQMGESNARQ